MKVLIKFRRKFTKQRLIFPTLFLMISCLAAANLRTAAQTIDLDGDGVPDYRDNCPSISNPEQMAFTSLREGNSEIFVMNTDGSGQRNLTSNPAFDGDPSFSHDGSRIAFTSARDSGNFFIYIMDADGSNQIRLHNTALMDSQPSFSPDDSRIVFTSTRDGNFEIYIMNIDGTNQTRLTNTIAEDRDPSFSPDGSKIVFTSNRDGNFEIYVMNSDGTNPTRLTSSAAIDEKPAFSPDGSKIAFTSMRDGNFEIYVMNADGSNPINLTNNPTYDADPVFSPDGSKIAFHSLVNQNFEVVVMNADGSNRINLTNMAESDLQPFWGAQADSDRDGIGNACDGTPPTITGRNITLEQGTTVNNLPIATVNDAEDAPNTLIVTVDGVTSSDIKSVTISNINVDSLGNVTATVSASCGATNENFTLRVTDSDGLFSKAPLNVTVQVDMSPPIINLRSTQMTLFPPDHKYTIIEVGQLVESVSDNCTSIDAGAVVIEKVTSDEADNSTGDGDTVNDIEIAAGCRSVKLRAERDGNGNGRVYKITLTVSDSAGGGAQSGNIGRVDYKVSVPKNHNGLPAVEDGPVLTINGGCQL